MAARFVGGQARLAGRRRTLAPMSEQTVTEPTLQASLDIDAPPAKVWAQLSDLTNMPKWSPQVRKTVVRGGRTRLGAQMFNFNRRGPLWWPTQAKVVAFSPERELAFRIKENWTIWRFTLEPLDGGTRTRLTEAREAPKGVSGISKFLTKIALGGKETFESELVEGMHATLQGIAAAAR